MLNRIFTFPVDVKMGLKGFSSASLLTITQFIFVNNVSADFCEFMICHPSEQYCCGDNKCCNYYDYRTWYLWGVAVLIGLLLVVLYFCSNACRSRELECDKVPIVSNRNPPLA